MWLDIRTLTSSLRRRGTGHTRGTLSSIPPTAVRSYCNQPACMSVRGETPWCLISRALQMRVASRHTPSIFICKSTFSINRKRANQNIRPALPPRHRLLRPRHTRRLLLPPRLPRQHLGRGRRASSRLLQLWPASPWAVAEPPGGSCGSRRTSGDGSERRSRRRAKLPHVKLD